MSKSVSCTKGAAGRKQMGHTHTRNMRVKTDGKKYAVICDWYNVKVPPDKNRAKHTRLNRNWVTRSKEPEDNLVF